MRPETAVVARPAVPPRVGLIASAANPTDGASSPERTENDGGTQWWKGSFGSLPEGCGSAGVFDLCESGAFEITSGPDIVAFQPFGVWAGDECGTWGFDARDFRGRAERQLRSCEGAQIEAEFWTGALARDKVNDDPDSTFSVNRYLASEDSDVITSGADTPTNVLALLEQALGDCNCGQQGMIHATRGVASLWHQGGALRREGNLLLTVNDTIVVPGAGYPGSGPYGPAADGHVWAYATGMVEVRRGPIVVTPDSFEKARNRADNDLEFYAARPAAATWDGCCLFAAEINAPMPDIAGS